ncbi:GT2 family glycosyltransferase [Gelidibacter algens]|uniref:GT2 family glycosyltransferase n=1 Tax=Gelidibacter algens TaxID=49280 RepID=A0A327S918_9FLAO|nr:glycosyltransferase family 2 protein [Gelidibacter algens]RAJ22257.1 GT2 family glycosyltransferase [Gelidibacter algens]
MFSKSIDIVVPTYNRPNEIKKFIYEIQKQTYLNYKVYIIDDCGSEDIKSLIPKNDAHFAYERLKENSGQAYARNYASTLGEGDIIIFMDDDAYFIQDNSLDLVLEYFEENEDVGFTMFNIKEPNRDWLSKRKNLNDFQEIGGFIACGCAFRRSTFLNSPGFSKEFHSYAEETDISMQLIKNSEKLVFASRVKVFHNYNPTERTQAWLKRFKYNTVRNDLAIVLTRYPTIYVIPNYIGKIISHLVFTLKFEKHKRLNFACIFKGAFASFYLSRKLKRDPLTMKQYDYWKSRRI